jgi:hypothetical protein
MRPIIAAGPAAPPGGCTADSVEVRLWLEDAQEAGAWYDATSGSDSDPPHSPPQLSPGGTSPVTCGNPPFPCGSRPHLFGSPPACRGSPPSPGGSPPAAAVGPPQHLAIVLDSFLVVALPTPRESCRRPSSLVGIWRTSGAEKNRLVLLAFIPTPTPFSCRGCHVRFFSLVQDLGQMVVTGAVLDFVPLLALRMQGLIRQVDYDVLIHNYQKVFHHAPGGPPT